MLLSELAGALAGRRANTAAVECTFRIISALYVFSHCGCSKYSHDGNFTA